jgi:DNA polymerase sigma
MDVSDRRHNVVPGKVIDGVFFPRRIRNKTKLERKGPRKRRRGKKTPAETNANEQKHKDNVNKDVGNYRNFSHKNIKQNRKLAKVKLNKLDDINSQKEQEEFTLFSFYSQIIGPTTPTTIHTNPHVAIGSGVTTNTIDGNSNSINNKHQYNSTSDSFYKSIHDNKNNNSSYNHINNYSNNSQYTHESHIELQQKRLQQQQHVAHNGSINDNSDIDRMEELNRVINQNAPPITNVSNLSTGPIPSFSPLARPPKNSNSSSSNWIFSSSSDDTQNVDNRKWWTSYVVAAAEVERQRRIKLNDEEIDEEARERYERQEWARRAIEAEQQRIISEYENNQRNDTVQHIDESSEYKDDYIIVCPNVSKGCEYEGHLRDIELHLVECEFSHGVKNDVVNNGTETSSNNDNVDDNSSYGVIMCPYSYFGCDHCCVKNELEEHIQACEFRGKTREDEEIERQNSILDAIQATEEEQQRRVEERHNEATLLGHDISNLTTPFTALQQIMDMQTKMLQNHLGREILVFSNKCHEIYTENKIYCNEIIVRLSSLLRTVAPNASIASYGSYSTGLSISSSDLDLFVKQSNDEGNPDILVLFGKMLEDSARDWVDNVQIITTAVVPVLKFHVHLPKKDCRNDQTSTEVDDVFSIAVDITMGNKNHTGITTAAFVQKMILLMPHLKPITLVLKSCFSKSNLNDTFTGGIPSYGIFLIVLSIVLHLQHAELPIPENSNSFEEQVHDGVTINQQDSHEKPQLLNEYNAENKYTRIAQKEVKVKPNFTPPASPRQKTNKTPPKLHIKQDSENRSNIQISQTHNDNYFENEKDHGIKLAVDICKNVQHIHEINFPSTMRTRRRSRSRSSSKHHHLLGEEVQYDEDEERKSIALGRLLMHILHFLGQTFDPTRYHISILHGGIFPRKNIPNDVGVDPLLLDDPLMPGNNVGIRCYRISEIQMKCANALTKLYRSLNRFKIRGKMSSKTTSNVLERVFETFVVNNNINNNINNTKGCE